VHTAKDNGCSNDEFTPRFSIAAVANNPKLREANGEINMFTILECVTGADWSDNEVPINVSVTINRVTGELTIDRRQDSNSQQGDEAVILDERANGR
jgi:hypothetical protein